MSRVSKTRSFIDRVPSVEASVSEQLFARDDSQNRLRDSLYSLSQSTWRVDVGVVSCSLPTAGWHKVALLSGHGEVTGASLGHNDLWGAQEIRVVSPGSQVLVATDEINHQSVIIGQCPTGISEPNLDYRYASFANSPVDLARDPFAQVYQLAQDAGDAIQYNLNLPVDQLAGDYIIRTTLGGYFRADCFGLCLATDEVTGVWLDLLQQSVEISGRDLEICSDGVNLSGNRQAKTSKLQLAGDLKWSHDVFPEVLPRVAENASRDDLPSLYSFENDGVPLYLVNMYAMSTTVVDQRFGEQFLKSDGRYTLAGDISIFGQEGYQFVEHQPPQDLGDQIWFPEVDTPESREALSATLSQWVESADSVHFTKPLIGLASATSEWVLDRTHFLYQVDPDSSPDYVPLSTAETEDVFRRNETMISNGSEDRDPVFAGRADLNLGKLASMFSVDKDGNVYFSNEYGAGLRFVGPTVIIEGAQLRVATTKDTVILSRDINLTANRDLNCTSRAFTRLYSDRNLVVAGGIGGEGGVLIENRGVNTEVRLPDDPQLAVYSGVAIRSIQSPVAIYGGDVLLQAGDGQTSSGDLIMRSRSGNVISTAANQYITQAPRHLQMFGSNITSPAGINYYDQNRFVTTATVTARSVFAQQDMIAGSSIQAISGRLAHSFRDGVGLVQNQSALRDIVQSEQQVLNTSRNQVSESLTPIMQRTHGPSRAMSVSVSAELSSGFTRSTSLNTHWGVTELQPTLPSVFQSTWVTNQKPIVPLTVPYKPNTSQRQQTVAWPGTAAARPIRTVAGVLRTEPRFTSLLRGDSTPIRIVEKYFGQVFFTLGDPDGV